jgi:hypothetical protein
MTDLSTPIDQKMAPKPGRFHDWRRSPLIVCGIAAAAAGTMLLGAGVGASAASATDAVTITSAGGSVSNGATVTVTGTGTPGEYIVVAECDSTLGDLDGTYCNSDYVGPITVGSDGTWTTTTGALTLDESFLPYDFETGSYQTSPSEVYLANYGSDQGQIQASEYTAFPPTAGPDGTAGVDITFPS